MAVCGYGDKVLRRALSQGVLLHHPVHLPHWTGVLVNSVSESQTCLVIACIEHHTRC
jgi:hypothetical protein